MLERGRKQSGFPRKYRLREHKTIDLLFRKGGFKACGFLKFRYLSQRLGHARVVISVSKRVGKAPDRNRLKRLIREALRQSGYCRDRSWDFAVFITRPPQRKPTLIEVQRYTGQFFSHLSHLSDESEKQME